MRERFSLQRHLCCATDAPAGNHWIKVRLEGSAMGTGTKSNRSAIGARVLVRYGGSAGTSRHQSVQFSFRQRSASALWLGSGNEANVEIHWPTGTSETFADLPADQLITIREGQSIVKGRPFR
jgi:hypothetical protein